MLIWGSDGEGFLLLRAEVGKDLSFKLKGERAKGGQLEKAMATHSSTPAWKIPWTEEPGGLQSVGLGRVGHD